MLELEKKKTLRQDWSHSVGLDYRRSATPPLEGETRSKMKWQNIFVKFIIFLILQYALMFRSPFEVTSRPPVGPSLGLALRLTLLASFLGFVQMTGAVTVDAGQEWMAAQTSLGAGAIVAGMLGYTHWPGAPRTLEICITHGSPHRSAIVQQLEQVRFDWPWAVRTIGANVTPPASCDAVVFDGWTESAQLQALRGLAHKPVLTIGMGAAFCSDGGIFCLQSVDGQTRFEVNIDGVTRSCLRINAQVLRLALPRKASVS